MKFQLVLLFSCMSALLSAQNLSMGRSATKGIDMNARPGGWVTEIKAEEDEIKGNVYLNENWLLSSIVFENGARINRAYVRYNIQTDYVEIKVQGKLGGVSGNSVKLFEFISPDSTRKVFVNASQYEIGNTRLTGFLEEVERGKVSLYAKTNVKLIRGAYVAALDMGDNSAEYSKSKIYYILMDDKLIEVIQNKKKFASNFPEVQNSILSFVKKNKLSLKKESDLKFIVAFMNRN